ncbi:MAG: helix-turn-helix domain-containing protein [Kiritimatiellia bacterium]
MKQENPIREFNIHGPHIRILFAQKRPTGNWRFDDLRAPYWRLYHHSGPGAWIQPGEKRIPLHPDFLYLIPPNLSFASGNERELQQFFVHFVIEPLVTSRRLKKSLYEIALTPGLRENLDLISRSANPTRQSLLLLALVQQCLGRSELNLRDRSLSTRLEQAQTLMRQHMREGISNPEIAQSLGMTPNAFIRWYKQEAGMPPQSWLNRERVHEASYWLHHNDAPIDRIAETVGFCDRFHFSRVFKQFQGVGPATFRKNRERLDAQLKV